MIHKSLGNACDRRRNLSKHRNQGGALQLAINCLYYAGMKRQQKRTRAANVQYIKVFTCIYIEMEGVCILESYIPFHRKLSYILHNFLYNDVVIWVWRHTEHIQEFPYMFTIWFSPELFDLPCHMSLSSIFKFEDDQPGICNRMLLANVFM
jgi:hypothetical protein